jgi:hypothetical protein
MRVKARPSSRPRIGGRSGRSDCSALRARLIQQETCTDYVNPYYGFVNITLSLDDDLIKKARKIAVERDTTLTGMVRDYLEGLATEAASSGRRRHEREALEQSFDRFRFKVGKRTWKRADLYVRS